MKCFLPLFILTGLLFGQDVLITIGGSQAKGKFIEVTEKHVVFQQAGTSVPSKIPKMSVARVVLSNGDVAYMLTDEMTNEFKEKRKNILEEEERKSSLTIEENQKLSGVKFFCSCVIAIAIILYLTPITQGLTTH
jgi:hypothetical protein